MVATLCSKGISIDPEGVSRDIVFWVVVPRPIAATPSLAD